MAVQRRRRTALSLIAGAAAVALTGTPAYAATAAPAPDAAPVMADHGAAGAHSGGHALPTRHGGNPGVDQPADHTGCSGAAALASVTDLRLELDAGQPVRVPVQDPAINATVGVVLAAAADPLTPADKDLVVKVRLAGLWEIPAGQLAQERASADRVKEVGQMISQQHTVLDETVRQVAAELRVGLPDRPNAQQQGWLDEMAGLSGAEFDRAYANLLRVAHGKIFPIIAGVRAGTRNDVVRTFAEAANKAVMTHMKLLESTLAVDFQALPEAPEPSVTPVGLPSGPPGVDPSLVWLVLVLAGLTGVVTTFRMIRPRR